MEQTPLASLSLTHVHYVSAPFGNILVLEAQTDSTTAIESHRFPVLPICVARSRSPSTMCGICDPHLGNPGSGGLVDVCRANGV